MPRKKKPAAPPPDRIPLGTFRIGAEFVDFVAMAYERGGSFFCSPKDTHRPRIEIGIAGGWQEAASVALHEIIEFAFVRTECRFQRDITFANDSASYLFIADHTQFGEIIARSGHAMSEVFPTLAQAYETHGGGAIE